VYVLPVREAVETPLAYFVRRGVKEAIQAKADVLILDMETKGGRVDACMEIIDLLGQFKGQTLTYVNREAYSAGAFIAVATQKIYMAPQSVIGAAAPILVGPGGSGPQAIPATMETKMVSAISAKVRAQAEKNGHNKEVAQAMVDRTTELVLDGQVINRKGNILTLTNLEAAKVYGTPKRPLLSLGTAASLDELLRELRLDKAQVVQMRPSGMERLASWLTLIAPLLLIVGIAGVYIEMKTPGFGAPGIIGITAFLLYFLGGYLAGLSGMEWMILFAIGLILVIVEIFVFPGTIAPGLIGAGMILASLVMAMVDRWPGMPALPSLPQLYLPLLNLLIAFGGGTVVVWLLNRWLPRSTSFKKLFPVSASGVASVAARSAAQAALVGQTGIAQSALRPGGKAQFGEEILDVMTQGEMIPKGAKVRIIGHSGTEAIVEPAG
jgi:membrane-bound serine protease (ClpP class)